MDKDFIITEKITECKNLISQAEKRLSMLPGDALNVRTRKYGYAYYLRHLEPDGKIREKYLSTTEKELIEQCSEAAYLRRLIPVLRKELKALQTFADHYDPQAKFNVWEKLHDGYKKHAAPAIRTNEEIMREWEAAPFETNSIPIPDGEENITVKGERVRSRIELISANIIRDFGLAYRYECRLDLPGGKTFPDFTIIHPQTQELYYVEIFGMMDDPDYAAAAFRKIRRYADAGLAAHLITLFEYKNARISSETVRATLEAYFGNSARHA